MPGMEGGLQGQHWISLHSENQGVEPLWWLVMGHSSHLSLNTHTGLGLQDLSGPWP